MSRGRIRPGRYPPIDPPKRGVRISVAIRGLRLSISRTGMTVRFGWRMFELSWTWRGLWRCRRR